MKSYNKLPFKERKIHMEYQYKQEARAEEREMKILEREKLAAYNEILSDKERQEQEAFARLAELANKCKGGE